MVISLETRKAEFIKSMISPHARIRVVEMLPKLDLLMLVEGVVPKSGVLSNETRRDETSTLRKTGWMMRHSSIHLLRRGTRQLRQIPRIVLLQLEAAHQRTLTEGGKRRKKEKR